jgi:hypothetical protein
MTHRDAVSIVACCMDRNTNLALALPSWLSSGAEQIVIVDWHSQEPVQTTLERELTVLHPHWTQKVEIVRVELPETNHRWVLSWAYNLGVRYARHPWLLKLDSDNVLHADFLDKTLGTAVIDQPADWCPHYWKGDWRSAKTRQQVYLNGVLLVSRAAFVAIGGYSEWIQSYGWEDSAAQISLEKTLGLKPIPLNPDLIDHLPHEDEQRVGSARNTFSEIHRNRFLDQGLPWSLLCQHCTFKPHPQADPQLLHHLTLDTWPIVPTEHAERATRELEKYIAIRVTLPLDPRPTPTPDKPKNPGKALLFVLVRNGLGNKMRALASAYTLFEGLNKSQIYNPHKHNWHLVIVWSQDEHCEASMADVFDLASLARDYPSQISIVSQLPTPMPTPLLELVDTNVFDEYKWSADTTTLLHSVTALLDLVAVKSIREEPVNVLLESASVIESPFRSWHDECKFLRGLKLSVEAQRLVDSTEQRILSLNGNVPMKDMVAVHVRRGQDASYDDVSKWSLDKQIQWKTWRSLSTVDTFVAEMLAMLDRNPELKFFVASDSADTFREMSRHFKPFTLFEQVRRDSFDRSVGQVQSAIADVVLVGKCYQLLGSQWSSFTELCRRCSELELRLAGIAF